MNPLSKYDILNQLIVTFDGKNIKPIIECLKKGICKVDDVGLNRLSHWQKAVIANGPYSLKAILTGKSQNPCIAEDQWRAFENDFKKYHGSIIEDLKTLAQVTKENILETNEEDKKDSVTDNTLVIYPRLQEDFIQTNIHEVTKQPDPNRPITTIHTDLKQYIVDLLDRMAIKPKLSEEDEQALKTINIFENIKKLEESEILKCLEKACQTPNPKLILILLDFVDLDNNNTLLESFLNKIIACLQKQYYCERDVKTFMSAAYKMALYSPVKIDTIIASIDNAIEGTELCLKLRTKNFWDTVKQEFQNKDFNKNHFLLRCGYVWEMEIKKVYHELQVKHFSSVKDGIQKFIKSLESQK